MTKPHQDDQAEPLFPTEEAAAERAAAGYEFKLPGHARTKSVLDLSGWQSGDMLEEFIARHQSEQCLTS